MSLGTACDLGSSSNQVNKGVWGVTKSKVLGFWDDALMSCEAAETAVKQEWVVSVSHRNKSISSEKNAKPT